MRPLLPYSKMHHSGAGAQEAVSLFCYCLLCYLMFAAALLLRARVVAALRCASPLLHQ